MKKLACYLCLLLWLGACAPTGEPTPAPPTPTAEPGLLVEPRSAEELAEQVPLLAEYQARVDEALTSNPPILLLPAEALPDEAAQVAQQVAVADPEFIRYVAEPNTGEPFRTEIMTVRPALVGDLAEAARAICETSPCYRVELYNFALNVASIAVVEVAGEQVVAVEHHQNAQPEINQRLTELATQIAVTAPEVAEALGLEPEPGMAVMANVKTALNSSRCERSRHLCVAPTFLTEDRALWAIVDLTDLRLVGLRWTELGESGPEVVITERSLQNEYVMQNFCQTTTSLAQLGWGLDYRLTGSDGLEVTAVTFQDEAVLNSAKVVDWHVSYSWEEGFGYSDAVGCPMFSTASVVAFDGPVVEDIVEGGEVVGFALRQDFRSAVWPLPCNYRYENRYEFYADGRFRVMVVNHGRGCGNEGTYRPVLRLDFAGLETVAAWDGADWEPWTVEQWQLQTDQPATPEGYRFALNQAGGGGYYLEPDRGQFSETGRGDNPYVYVTARAEGEGDTDLITIGPCCNNDHRQGPEKFMEPPQSLENREAILWYVPQLENDDTPGAEYCWADTVVQGGTFVIETWPCAGGPMFVPFGEGED